MKKMSVLVRTLLSDYHLPSDVVVGDCGQSLPSLSSPGLMLQVAAVAVVAVVPMQQ
jgi:hypothetical protein